MTSFASTTIELTDAQANILSVLIDLYYSSPVKGKQIAAELDRNPGTIRTQMQSLKSLQLVEGIPGPKGGYKPTLGAYEVLDIEESDSIASVPIRHDGEPLDGITAREFDLINLHHPDRREAEIGVRGRIHDLGKGDRIAIGPTPASKLVAEGVIDGISRSEGVIVIEIENLYIEDGEAAGNGGR
ncbi:MAG: TrmB family transcriptional regulator [Salinigranum sp.]